MHGSPNRYVPPLIQELQTIVNMLLLCLEMYLCNSLAADVALVYVSSVRCFLQCLHYYVNGQHCISENGI